MSGLVTSSWRRRGAWVLLVASVAVAFALNLTLGAVSIPFDQVIGTVGDAFGLRIGSEPSVTSRAVVWNIRIPRALMTIITGAAFSAAGAALQGMFRNRLADPYLLGIGPGAALGGVIGATAGGSTGAIAGATVTGMLTGLMVKRLSASRIGEPSRFILTGLAFGLAITAWVGFVVFTGDRTRVPPLEFWILGNLAGTTWSTVGTALTIVFVSFVALVAGGRALDLLTLGEADARRLGLDVGLALTVLLLAVGALTGAATGAGGVIVFVGLLGPHIARRLAGPTHRALLLASALSGAALVGFADLVARTVTSPREIPVGLVMAAIGGPFFLWLARVPDYESP